MIYNFKIIFYEYQLESTFTVLKKNYLNINKVVFVSWTLKFHWGNIGAI